MSLSAMICATVSMSVAQERLHAEPRQFLLAHAGLLAQQREHLQAIALGLGQVLGCAEGG